MSIDKIDNHIEQALARLLEQYKCAENLKGIIRIYGKQIQELEDIIHDQFVSKALPTAVGAQLDLIGVIVGQPRNGYADDRYRVLILVKIGQNTSEGTGPDVINVFKLLTEAEYVHYINLTQAEVQLQTTSEIAEEDIDFTYRSMQKVVAGGVRVAYIICADNDEAFAFRGVNDPAKAKGFSSVFDTAKGGLLGTLHQYKPPFGFDGSSTVTEGFGTVFGDPLAGGVLQSVN